MQPSPNTTKLPFMGLNMEKDFKFIVAFTIPKYNQTPSMSSKFEKDLSSLSYN